MSRAENSLYLAGNILGPEALEREHEARRTAGLPSRFLDRKTLREQFGIARAAAIMGYGNLVIDPRKCALALLKAAGENGARLFAPTEITDVKPMRTGVRATAANGHTIHCAQLIFATGYELPLGVPGRHHQITSTWAIATVRQQRRRLWAGECCIWEASKPYLYIRTTPDGRVICGGEDAEFSDAGNRKQLLAHKTAVLQRKLHRLLPQLDPTVEFAWTGAFGETTTGLPIIGPVPGMSQVLDRAWIRWQRHYLRRPGGRHYRRGDGRPSRCRCRSLSLSSPQVAALSAGNYYPAVPVVG